MTIQIRIKWDSKETISFQIDEQDLHLVIGYKCQAAKRGDKWYLYNRELNSYVHRSIMNPPKGMVVDHIDGDSQNNTRANLRVVTQQQNSANTKIAKNNRSGYKGVSFEAYTKKWKAKINHQGKQITIGRYDTAEAAALAYNIKAIELNGEYAYLNVIQVTA